MTIEDLNRRFGRRPELTFEAGPGGLAVASIAGRLAQARIALHGGHVLSFQARGERPVLWLSAHSQYQAGRPIRGGIPICWPWFGPHETDPARPAHGFARTARWAVRGATVTPDERTELRLGLRD